MTNFYQIICLEGLLIFSKKHRGDGMIESGAGVSGTLSLPPTQIRVAASARDKIRVVPKEISKAASDFPLTHSDAVNPIELDSPYNIARTNITAGNYIFTFNVEEKSINALDKPDYIFRVNVYVDGALKAAFCVGQKLVNNEVVEGVTCIVDVGENIPSSISILVLPIKLP